MNRYTMIPFPLIRSLFALLLLACSFAVQAQEKMLYVEYRVMSPKLPPSSTETQVRKLWLVGDKYMRFEDVPNVETGVHGLIIVAEPDIWILDRKTNKGQHSVDPGPSYAVHFPMLATETSERLRRLEFGNELAYFQQNGARELANQVLDGVNCTVFALDMDEHELFLYVRKDGKPFQITVKTDASEYSVRIVKYEPGSQPDLNLFRPPVGARFN